ncbi:MAG: GIY-YIG nuclease family protein [Flavobacteriales bacterium]|nr:GIY-YIG nuclease family protein [Flavobacteriales bacterium]
MRFHIYYVYILKCSDGSFYTGITNNIHRRLQEHQEGISKSAYTFSRRPVELVFLTEFSNVEVAIETEKQIKKWSRRKKQALIDENYDTLIQLSKKRFRV